MHVCVCAIVCVDVSVCVFVCLCVILERPIASQLNLHEVFPNFAFEKRILMSLSLAGKITKIKMCVCPHLPSHQSPFLVKASPIPYSQSVPLVIKL